MFLCEKCHKDSGCDLFHMAVSFGACEVCKRPHTCLACQGPARVVTKFVHVTNTNNVLLMPLALQGCKTALLFVAMNKHEKLWTEYSKLRWSFALPNIYFPARGCIGYEGRPNLHVHPIGTELERAKLTAALKPELVIEVRLAGKVRDCVDLKMKCWDGLTGRR